MLICSKRVTLSDFVHSATFPASANVLSRRSKEDLSVVAHREAVALGAQTKAVPLVGADLQICAFELFATSLDDPIEAHVVFERVGASDIIVVGVAKAERNAAGLIDLARDGFETDDHLQICSRGRVMHRKGKPVVGPIGADLLDRAAGGCRRIGGDAPLRRSALAGACEA